MKISSARFVASATAPPSFPKDERPEVAFLGRSNVGKSSLLNALLNQKGLARTSSTPGRTQAINFFLINEAFYFTDLPGYGYAKVSKAARASWGQLIEIYLAQRRQLVLSILIVDSRHEPSPLDLQMKTWLQHFGLPFLVVSTKIDKLSANERRASLQRARKLLETERVIPFSALTREGGRQLWDEIQSSLTGSNITKLTRSTGGN
ncbi:MAG TPA: ribosome biogenesis GTP-binding protein YihA/YsxC [Blastocatellia bacterium]|nr:ribosome biogenesis GTP-binding protein YihA/YsxC [Blastocatellia bacterium]